MTVAALCTEKHYSTLELSLDDEVLTVRVSRPEALNALSPLVIAELRDLFQTFTDHIGQPMTGEDAAPDWSIRGVILTGAGEKSFVAGADIASMRDMSAEEARSYAAEAHELTLQIELLPVPVIAAVNGFALGGGCELALACDYIFASERASFGQPEVALGLLPGFGGSVRLQQVVGRAAASELVLTGRRITSAEALNLGLVLRVFPDTASLLSAAHDSVRAAAANSPAAVAAAKRTLRDVHSVPTALGLDIERDAFAARFGSADMREGTAAFVEKRPAQFIGK